ncbi:MAG: Transcriptional regulator, TrmB [uncultured bacterium]|uniref:Transcriptional regulator, TrmB n=1 Tax=Candidatus Wolfebacteria bacterium GW2011_GWE2_44_13 TaxID=1619017 RepID=A0A0G1H8S3_9BACT|nr:MAG: Transcriptional regulator, TrmB [uncultured bacterium]KKT43185.1 MAG: Transcriptional regulator, TrmB [Candidatus Wolfebacteria bacterium GW2011_GWE2_44_13]
MHYFLYCVVRKLDMLAIYLYSLYMSLSEQLQSIGLSDKEAAVYLQSLSLGSFAVSDIAKKTGLKRPTCYLILEELAKRGLVAIVPQKDKLTYTAESPNILFARAEEHMQTVKQMLPDLFTIQKSTGAQPTIKFYSGKTGIHSIYDDILSSGVKEYFYIGSSADLAKTAGEDFMAQWVRKRIDLGIHATGIRTEHSEINDTLYAKDAHHLRDIRFAPLGFELPHTIALYGTKVAVISAQQDSFGFIVDNADFRNTLQFLFKALWQISTPATVVKKSVKKSSAK